MFKKQSSEIWRTRKCYLYLFYKETLYTTTCSSSRGNSDVRMQHVRCISHVIQSDPARIRASYLKGNLVIFPKSNFQDFRNDSLLLHDRHLKLKTEKLENTLYKKEALYFLHEK